MLIGLLVLGALGAALRGRLERVPLPEPTRAGQTAPPQETGPSEYPSVPEMTPFPTEAFDGVELPPWLSSVFWSVVAIVGAVLVGLLLRRILANRRDSGDRRPAGNVAGATEATAIEESPDLAEPIAQAWAQLRSATPPRDAVVSAWVALEEGAARRGAAREAAETPTEFTEYIQRTTRVDPSAVADLRTRYLAARFGTQPVTQDDVEHAAEALSRIEATWSR